LKNKRLPAKISVVARFAPQSFLKNIAIRWDGSVFITVANPTPLNYLPNPSSTEVTHTFHSWVVDIVEVQPDIFYISVGDLVSSVDGGSGSGAAILCKFEMRSSSL